MTASAHPPARASRPGGRSRTGRQLASLGVALALVLCPGTASALADEADELFGATAAERGLPVDDGPAIDARFAAVIDETGAPCFGRRATEPAQIASLTKIMTAIVACEALAPDARIEVTPTAAAVGESSAGLVAGDVMTLDAALKALLTASGNDAAVAIAETAGAALLASDGMPGADAATCQDAFVDAMNAKAAELGLAGTRFANPHGLDFDAYAQGQCSCARDVAVMLRCALGIDLVRASIGWSSVDIVVDRGGADAVLTETNTDMLLQSYEGACAAKTGYTLAAGPCVAAAVNRGDGHEYYAVVLASSSKPQRFADAAALFDWTYARRDALASPAAAPAPPAEPSAPETESYQLVTAARTVSAVIGGRADAYPVVARVAHADWADRAVDATVAEPGKTVAVPKGGGRIEQEATFRELSGDVSVGDVVGRLAFRQDGEVLWETDLLAAEDLAAPTWWEGLAVAAQRFFGGLIGQPAAAESALEGTGAMRVS